MRKILGDANENESAMKILDENAMKILNGVGDGVGVRSASVCGYRGRS